MTKDLGVCLRVRLGAGMRPSSGNSASIGARSDRSPPAFAS
jgi:hypothetical protein